jgi:hypothetical protein
LQTNPQVCATQVVDALATTGHALPQVPQLVGSDSVYTHVPLHTMLGATQPVLQTPDEQTWPEVQVVPQVPQLAGSLVVSTHWPLHFENPVLHWIPHWLFAQTAVALATEGHWLPHVPQLASSVAVATQTLPHLVHPALQENPHCPSAQLGAPSDGAGHTVPQFPQFEVSLCLSTQAPLHSLRVPVQVMPQTPAEHTSAAVHWWLHVPQFEALDWRLTHAPEQGV